MKNLALLLALVACAHPVQSAPAPAELRAEVASCDMTLAVPVDGTNMGATIQGWADRCGLARIGTGRFVITGKLVSSRWNALVLDGDKSIVGSGPASVLVFEGDGISVHPTTGIQSGDWRGISITGDNNLVADLTIDTSSLVNTSEQTHAIHITGPAHNNTIRGLWFQHPVRRDPSGRAWPGGDCIKIASYETTPSSTHILGNQFVTCDRSGVASVGGFDGLIISDNTFHEVGDQDVDVEGAGNVGRSFLANGNIHKLGKRSTSGLAIQVGLRDGFGINVSNSIFDGRGVFFGGVRAVTFANNTIHHRKGDAPTLDFVKVTDEVKIIGNRITRAGTTWPNAVVKIQHHGTGTPGLIEIADTTIRNETPIATALTVQSAHTVRLSNNTFQWAPSTVPAGSTHTLVGIAGLAKRTDVLTVQGNLFTGPAQRALQFNDKDAGIGVVTLTGNTSMVPIFCQRVMTGAFGPLVANGNNWPVPLGNCSFEVGR